MGECTYPIFLFRSIVGFSNANAVAFVADSLIRTLLNRLAPVKSDVSSHLRGHRRESKLVLSFDLSQASLAAEGRDGKLKSTSCRLWDCLLSCMLLASSLASLNWQKRSQ